jgi:predicted transcriptional regulator
MAIYTHRVQTVLSDEQFTLLSQMAERLGKPISVLIRQAVEDVHFKQASLDRRRAALADLLAMNAPVAEWEQMEKEIAQGAQE